METGTYSADDYEKLAKDYAVIESRNSELVAENAKLKESLASMQSRLDWFSRQVLGKTSEKHHPANIEQLPLFSQQEVEVREVEGKEVGGYTRKKRGSTQALGDNTDSGLRFDEGVEIVVEDIYPKEVKGLDKDAYIELEPEISDRLASRISKTFVHRRVFHKIKLKETNRVDSSESTANLPAIIKAPVPAQVLSRSYMSVSFVADMLLDKCLYSIPICRQHKRLSYDGIHLARGTLTQNFIKGCALLERVVEAQSFSILAGRNLAIDETPVRVGVNKAKHKMNKAYIWPVYGESDEIVFHYNKSRAAAVISEIIGSFSGTILSDGYSAYESYAKGVAESALDEQEVTLANCWVHARRKFVKLEKSRPDDYSKAIELIYPLFEIEGSLKGESEEAIYRKRQSESLPVVDEYFAWLRSFSGQAVVATHRDLRLAISYSLEREEAMRVFLRDPKVQLDTNYLERQIRTWAIGRKNWLFCWTEVGAQSLCFAQSLICTCLLHGVSPRVYLIDVLQRLALERGADDDVSDLIPRLWKDSYASNPMPCPTEAVARARAPDNLTRWL